MQSYCVKAQQQGSLFQLTWTSHWQQLSGRTSEIMAMAHDEESHEEFIRQHSQRPKEQLERRNLMVAVFKRSHLA